MRVLMENRAVSSGIVGGDIIQMLETKAALERVGVQVDIANKPNADLAQYDLVHLFNITSIRDSYEQCQTAVRFGKPIALSPIYWDLREYRQRGAQGDTLLQDLGFLLKTDGAALTRLVPEQVRELVPSVKERLAGALRGSGGISASDEQSMQSYVLENSSVILPNAPSEADLICRHFGDRLRTKIHVVPNAVNPKMRETRSDWFHEQTGLENFVLCVGSVYSRKNQLALVRALDGTGLDVVLVGSTPSKRYLKTCLDYCRDHLHVIGPVDHERLSAIYARAAIHAQPSWYETPGLSSLEAALFGCKVVVTDRGTARDYFGDLARYCDPSSLSSIRRAVMEAVDQPSVPELQHKVGANYTWAVAALETVEGYKRISGNAVLG